MITQGQVYRQDSIGYTETELGVYNFEFTGANYVLLCGAILPRITTWCETYYYVTVLSGKTIYDHVVNISHYPASFGRSSLVYCNGQLLLYGDDSYFTPLGVYNIDVDNIQYTTGIQNCMRLWSEEGNRTSTSAGNVLIVS